jgi:hypothetical protein
VKRLLQFELGTSDVPQRPEGLWSVQPVTKADVDARRIANRSEEALDQRTLPDSGLAPDQDDPASGRVDLVEQIPE